MARSERSAPSGSIRLRGVRQNNLQGLDCDIPLGRLTVITGVSGSGKSSLAFDTLYAEGQRRYMETFSAYTRQFLDRLARPEAESIEGVPPAIAIDPSGAVKTSRSTVGTLTGINDYLKLLWARASTTHCPGCDRPVRREDPSAVVAALADLGPDAWPVLVVAPVPIGRFDGPELISAGLRSRGFVRYLRGSEVRRIEELAPEDCRGSELPVVVDRLSGPDVGRSRQSDSVEQAFRAGGGKLRIVGRDRSRTFTAGLGCGDCGTTIQAPSPGLFSFNTPYGACPGCRGFGRVIGLDWSRVVPDERLSIREGAIRPWQSPSRRKHRSRCIRACEERGVPVDAPWRELPAADRAWILEGGGGWPGVRGFFDRLERKKYKMHVRVLLSRYRGYFPCPDCGGGRLRPEAACHRVAGLRLPELWALPVRDARRTMETLAQGSLERPVRLIVDEVLSRLRYLDSVGLGYLSLDRQSRTLSGGEVERVNLTAALGASLVETLFVLDEPSIGLHPRDNDRLLEILREIRTRGNTVVVVEHDPEILAAADHLIDMGPGAGRSGGRIVAQGAVAEVARCPDSLTGRYLSGDLSNEVAGAPAPRRAGDGGKIRVRGARQNNLQGVDVDLPVSGLTVITGVSGSGKSTLIHDVVWGTYLRSRGEAVDAEPDVDLVDGFDRVDEVVMVDQSPLGRTPRGNPATYTKSFDIIRRLFAATDEARARGFGAGTFSFNVDGGRCPECKGAGATQVEMQFLSDVTIPCDACRGQRFRPEVLAVRLHGRNVHEILETTVAEAVELFPEELALQDKLGFLDSLGLGYLRLGQPLNTLSGGEAQRLKLASRVMSARKERLLFLIDEPTTGLHLHDIRGLLRVLRDLVDAGHGALVIEHHLDVIAAADRVVDLGPEGGDGGGRVVAQGTVEEVAGCDGSITGEWLRRHTSSRGKARPSLPPEAEMPAGAEAPDAPPRDVIRVVGARENNLKDITVDVPRGELVVVTGLSGAGKSSLVHDIIFAEGQRRYLDCLSAYARQFVEDLHRPDIDHLEGIPPTVAVGQRTTPGGHKSTVGTVTEIYHGLRLLYTRAGTQMCPDCEVEVEPRRRPDILRVVRRLGRSGGRLLAPVVRGRKGFHNRLLARARRQGILDARVDGEWLAIPEDREVRLARHVPHDIDLVVARWREGRPEPGDLDSRLDRGLDLGAGVVRWLADDGEETVFNLHRSCPSCGRDFDEPDPWSFSFHSRHGACARCSGHGVLREVDPDLLIARWDLPLEHHPRGPLAWLDEAPFRRGARRRFLREVGQARGLPSDGRPLADWGARSLKALFHGQRSSGFRGLLDLVERTLATRDEAARSALLDAWGRDRPCPACGGSRLRDVWSSVRVGGRTISEVTSTSAGKLLDSLERLEPRGGHERVVRPILEEIGGRLSFLREVGLDYLTLDRPVQTLSGGEAQRIRLAAQLGSNLRGACYILDEPTIGLHARDGERLLASLRRLRDQGNTVLVIEHDEATVEAADRIVDMGPGPGRHGGEVVAQGTLEEVMLEERSSTGRYFRERGERRVALASDPRAEQPSLTVEGATRHNLKDVSARFPLGSVTVVTGVSGAGKSTLVRDVLEESVRRRLRGLRGDAAGAGRVGGAELVQGVREVDQLPIGRTPRSTPATYVGIWNRIRRIFASLPDARARGYDARRFSFNTAGGRCEACSGQGRIRMEMDFLPDVFVDCESCGGARFSAETLEVEYRGKSIGDVLGLSVEEALDFFSSYGDLCRGLRALDDLGLGYLTLGQASTTLSGGEAQRVKLAVELAKRSSDTWLYLFDEPTTGLHMMDVARLVEILRRLARAGHAVVVIEHHVEVIAGADWVVDLGPGGGDAGGELLYQGPVAGLLDAADRSPTAGSLASFLASTATA